MNGLETTLVRAYFEGNGFLLRQRSLEPASARRRRTPAPVAWELSNPAPEPGETPPGFQLFSGDLRRLERAWAVHPGGEAGRFQPGLLRGGAPFVAWLRREVAEAAAAAFLALQQEDPAPPERSRILLLPALPAQDQVREESIALLREHGVGHVLTLRTILEFLLRAADPSADPSEATPLQLLRLLRAYDLVRDPQLELFKPPHPQKS